MSLKGKTALITGSTQGLGYAMAERLASLGCNIVMNGLGDATQIEERRLALEKAQGVRVVHSAADLAQPAQIESMVKAAESAFPSIDILINNAVVRHFAPLEKFRPADWDRALAVNLSAAFHAARLVLPGMRRRDFGRIINISSIYGLRAAVDRIDYVTTKTALLGFTRAVALEVAAQNITCNAICPGSAPTPAIEKRFAEFMAKEGLPREEAERVFMSSRQPSGRFVGMDGVAGLAAFLCGADARDINGAQISIDGAWSAA